MVMFHSHVKLPGSTMNVGQTDDQCAEVAHSQGASDDDPAIKKILASPHGWATKTMTQINPNQFKQRLNGLT